MGRFMASIKTQKLWLVDLIWFAFFVYFCFPLRVGTSELAVFRGTYGARDLNWGFFYISPHLLPFVFLNTISLELSHGQLLWTGSSCFPLSTVELESEGRPSICLQYLLVKYFLHWELSTPCPRISFHLSRISFLTYSLHCSSGLATTLWKTLWGKRERNKAFQDILQLVGKQRQSPCSERPLFRWTIAHARKKNSPSCGISSERVMALHRWKELGQAKFSRCPSSGLLWFPRGNFMRNKSHFLHGIL